MCYNRAKVADEAPFLTFYIIQHFYYILSAYGANTEMKQNKIEAIATATNKNKKNPPKHMIEPVSLQHSRWDPCSYKNCNGLDI